MFDKRDINNAINIYVQGMQIREEKNASKLINYVISLPLNVPLKILT